MNAEFNGSWIRRGAVWVPVLAPEPKPAPRKPKLSDPVGRLVADIVWTDETLRDAHAAYVRGNRDVATLAGHREWYRRWKADVRAGRRMSKTDRRWAEKSAVKGSWLMDERTNRVLGSLTLREENHHD